MHLAYLVYFFIYIPYPATSQLEKEGVRLRGKFDMGAHVTVYWWGKTCSYLYQFSYMQNSIREGFHNSIFNARAPINLKISGGFPWTLPLPPPSAAHCSNRFWVDTITSHPPRLNRGLASVHCSLVKGGY